MTQNKYLIGQIGVLVLYLDSESHVILHSRGDGHQELVEAPEEDVGCIAEPDVVSVDHEEQQACLQCCDHCDHQLRPDVPPNFCKACCEGCYRACRKTNSSQG